MTTYRSATCGCCMKWVDAMRRAGFRVEVRESDDMAAVKQRLKVPSSVYSCHTTVVGGLVVEGHVPAAAAIIMIISNPMRNPSRMNPACVAAQSRAKLAGAGDTVSMLASENPSGRLCDAFHLQVQEWRVSTEPKPVGYEALGR